MRNYSTFVAFDRLGAAITVAAGSGEQRGCAVSKMATQTPRAPSAMLALAELGRASLETSSLALGAPLMAEVPRGDGHDVIVLPGFAFSELSTLLLRTYLRSLG